MTFEERVQATEEAFMAWLQDNKRRVTPDGRVRPPQAASLVGVQEKTLANMRGQGIGPRYVKLAGQISYRVADLAAWIIASEKSTVDGALVELKKEI